MSKELSHSPQRGQFQREFYTDADTITVFDKLQEEALEREKDSEWQKDNLEYDLRTNEFMLQKVRENKCYAQNLYAALCNNDFIKNDVWPILQDKSWSCSWRHAGGIIADMRQEGDYIEWYCSGMSDMWEDEQPDIVGEGHVTDEVRADLLNLGWIVSTVEDE